ncbi:Cell shape-determining protein MreC precursor [Anoxybacillus sp. BCO1]|nr:Cell shape-determining protein MreC precursor [Anoxybacillus sp. BCO1]
MEKFAKDTVVFMQSIVHKPAQLVAGFFENVNDLRRTYEENKQLKAHLEQYVLLQSEVESLKKENERLRELLDKKKVYVILSPFKRR